MTGNLGDRISIESQKVGHAPREGEILEVTDSPSGWHFRIRKGGAKEPERPRPGDRCRVVASVLCAACRAWGPAQFVRRRM